MDNVEANSEAVSKPTKEKLKQLGVWGILFFTIKGLLWLIIPFLIAKGCM